MKCFLFVLFLGKPGCENPDTDHSKTNDKVLRNGRLLSIDIANELNDSIIYSEGELRSHDSGEDWKNTYASEGVEVIEIQQHIKSSSKISHSLPSPNFVPRKIPSSRSVVTIKSV